MPKVTHGAALLNVRLYRVWNTMRQRCYSPTHPMFANYGGRGIKVCPEWHNPRTFVDWCLANGWRCGLSIDRVDNDLGYCPGNCKFSTPSEQARNRTNTANVSYNGRRITWAELGEISGVPADKIRRRVLVGGATIEAAMQPTIAARPPRWKPTPLLECGGEAMTAVEWAKRAGVSRKTIYARMREGKPLGGPSEKPWLNSLTAAAGVRTRKADEQE